MAGGQSGGQAGGTTTTERHPYHEEAVFVAALLALNVATFGFHALVSRFLGPKSYGALGTLTAAALLVSIPLSSLQVAVTHEVARSQGHRDVRHLERTFTAAAVGVFIVTAVLSPLLRTFLHLGSIWPVLVLGLYLSAVVVEVVPRGVLIGQRRFTPVTVSLILDAVIRLGVGAALAASLGTAAGALFGFAAGEVVAAGWQLAASATNRPPDGFRLDSARAGALWSVVAFTGFFALASIDTITVRHLLSRTASGYYAAASTAGGIAFFAPLTLTMAVFPRLVKVGEPAAEAGSWRGPLLLVAVASAAPAAVLSLLPRFVIRILFGGAYLGAEPALRLLGVSYGIMGVSYFFMNWELARRCRALLLPWVAAVGMLIAIVLNHGTIAGVATDALIANAALVVCLAFRGRRILTASRRP